MAIEALNHDLLAIKQHLSTFVHGVEENIEFLASSSSFLQFVEAVTTEDSARISRTASELLPDLLRFAERKQIYYQLIFMDRHGDEIFVIERDGARYRTLDPQELNRSGTSFYRYLAGEIPANQATLVPVELSSQDSNTVLPVISCLYPIYHEDLAGLLIFQIYAQTFFRTMEQEMPLGPRGKVMLVNSDGYYLYHSEKKKHWNQLLASKDSLNLKVDYGEEMASRLIFRPSELFTEIDDEIVAHLPLFDVHKGLENEYTILKSASKAEVFSPAETFKKIFLGLLGLFLIVSLFLAYLATRQFTGPIEKLSREAEVIAQGDYHSRVEVQTYDEIGDLGQQFNIMAESLEQREAEIAQHREHLEQMVQARTRELRKEKNKLQAILDNVPSGFVLLDKDHRILSASAALQSITGKSGKELLGQPCYIVLGSDPVGSDNPATRTFHSGKMETQVVRRCCPEGEEHFLELIAVPLKKDGRVENVLEIITDVTDRKRLHDQLLRSERLAATGEMAAVIAHEMRNSLTSVRMLLQLLAETNNLDSGDRESLDVTLDSLSRMERVVNNLLQLARPAQLTKRSESVNEIIKDGVEFAKPQMVHKRIDLQVELATDLPQIELDREHLKEAMVNLILNASQSIETKGEIFIHSVVTTLTKKMHDLGEVRITADERVSVGVREVVLKKGRQVVKIEIRDSGCGIPGAHLERIFDPFFTTKINGTGLGLSFVKRVVNEHGGIVRAESEPGKGSCFSILIPV